MITDEALEKALDWLRDNATKAAQARAEREYMGEWIGACRAKIAATLIEAGESAAAADLKAKAHPDYRTGLGPML
jgi:translation elongation factor EF-Ts